MTNEYFKNSFVYQTQIYKSPEISEKEMHHDTLLRRAITNILEFRDFGAEIGPIPKAKMRCFSQI